MVVLANKIFSDDFVEEHLFGMDEFLELFVAVFGGIGFESAGHPGKELPALSDSPLFGGVVIPAFFRIENDIDLVLVLLSGYVLFVEGDLHFPKL